ncbi:AAA domain-containing protein [Streptomyces marincola]|uniref:AAA domain-containing protein n=1 Tax=Streptomyces marincola TaxID=2878388 RepID=UPI001CF2489F|nr:AAA domain-containing protein [Streptomyces marincola]UCM88942.1 AAA domain-containing protein [Streptomyces marincola]
MKQPVLRADDPQVVRHTRDLVEFLREFVRSSYKPVRDCSKYKQVLWLAECPDELVPAKLAASGVLFKVKHYPVRPAPTVPDVLQGWIEPQDVASATAGDPHLADVGPGRGYAEDEDGNTYETDEIAREDALEVLSAYSRWLPEWRRWAQREQAEEPYRQLHRRLYRMATQIQREGEVFEAVLSTGLLSLDRGSKRERVHRHVLTVPLVLAVDPVTIHITVSLSDGDSPRLEDGDFLDESHGYTAQLLNALRSRVEEDTFHPLSTDALEVLRSWCERAFGMEHAARFDDSWSRPDETSPAEPSVSFTPAIVLRERGQGALVTFYDGIARRLARPGAVSPLGLAQLLFQIEPEERTGWAAGGAGGFEAALGPDPLFPLPVNRAQREVLSRLQKDTGVVVQGPPGTGKTHTIANLISALLADGKRVLVTSEKAQALRVLRDKIPQKLRQLCVLQGDFRYEGGDELGQSVRSLSYLSASVTTDQLAERIEGHQQDRSDLEKLQVELRADLRDLREAEWVEHLESAVAPGYSGRLAEIVALVSGQEASYEWLPELPAAASTRPPITAEEAQRLLGLVGRHGFEVLTSRAFLCPAPESLPAPARFEELVRSLQAALEVSGSAPSEASLTMAERGEKLIDTVIRLLDTAERALQQEGLPADPVTWPQDHWETTALVDGMSDKRQQLWEGVRRHSARAKEKRDQLLSMPLMEVVLPQVSQTEEPHQRAAAREFAQYLRTNGQPSRWALKKPFHKQARPLLENCRVDGRVPRTAEEVEAVVVHLELRECARQLQERWKAFPFPKVEGDSEVLLSELLDRYTLLQAVDSFTGAARSVHDALVKAGVKGLMVRSPEQWNEVRQTAERARLVLSARLAECELASLIESLPNPSGADVPELAEVHRAASNRDATAYARAIDAVGAAYLREADRRQAYELLTHLQEGLPELGRAFATSPTDPQWQGRFAALDQAWSWQLAKRFMDRMLSPGREPQLERELAEVEAQLKGVKEQLAADRALLHCLSRMTTRQKQALSAYATAMSHAGRGATAQGKRHLAAARSAMRDARGAVPAWVMPLRQVVEMLDPEPDAFDVVIVDEASQVGLSGLLLLWLAPRVIVVGDDKQCAPFYTGNKHDQINQKVDERLAGFTDWQRDGFNPKSNLYELLSARFPEVIRLTEHFRCMPEIIKWSSQQFYPDNELVPLRQYGADRLRPLEVVHVREGYCEGARERLVNRPEAERLVGKLRELISDPAYAGRSIGVIVLRSGAQTRLLEDLIDAEIGPEASERHNIRVGTAEQFQGDERDVILLSMVVDGDHARALTGLNDGRRFNVAASRGRDQMWLFTSVTPDQLSSKDLRHSLLTYMQNPPALHPAPPTLAAVTPDERCDPFDSLFEQKVFLEIRRRGYHVLPQWEVAGKFIDLVVVGENARLAVECDGSPHHTTSKKRQEDYERERDLRRAGWTFWRVRSSEFALAPDQALAPLWRKLAALDIQPGTAGFEQFASDGASTWNPVALYDEAQDADVDDETTDDEDLSADDARGDLT